MKIGLDTAVVAQSLRDSERDTYKEDSRLRDAQSKWKASAGEKK